MKLTAFPQWAHEDSDERLKAECKVRLQEHFVFLTRDGPLGGVSQPSREHLLPRGGARDGAVFHSIVASISLAVDPLQSDAMICLSHSLQARGGIQC